MKKVIIVEEPALKVAKIIKDKGYLLGNSLGMRGNSHPDLDCISVLKESPPIEKSFLWWHWRKRQRALVIAEIWIDNASRRAKSESRWVIEAFGREYLPEVKRLVNILAGEFNVEMAIKLKSERVSRETLWSDFGMPY